MCFTVERLQKFHSRKTRKKHLLYPWWYYFSSWSIFGNTLHFSTYPLQQQYQNGQQSNLMVMDPVAALKSNLAVQSQPMQYSHQVIVYYPSTVDKC